MRHRKAGWLGAALIGLACPVGARDFSSYVDSSLRGGSSQMQSGMDLDQVSRPQTYRRNGMGESYNTPTEYMPRARMVSPPTPLDTSSMHYSAPKLLNKQDEEIGAPERFSMPHRLLSKPQEAIDSPGLIQRPRLMTGSNITSEIASPRNYDSGMRNRQTSLVETQTSDLTTLHHGDRIPAPNYAAESTAGLSYGGLGRGNQGGQRFDRLAGNMPAHDLPYDAPNPNLSPLTGVSRLKASTQRGDLPKNPSFTQESLLPSDFRPAKPGRVMEVRQPDVSNAATPNVTSGDLNAARVGNKLTTMTAPVYPIR